MSLRLQGPIVGGTGEWTWQKLPSQPRLLAAVTNTKNPPPPKPTCKAVTNVVDGPNATAVTNAMYCTLMTYSLNCKMRKDALCPPPFFLPLHWSLPLILHPSSAATLLNPLTIISYFLPSSFLHLSIIIDRLMTADIWDISVPYLPSSSLQRVEMNFSLEEVVTSLFLG